MLAEDIGGLDGWPARIDVLPRWVRFAVPATAVVTALVAASAGWLVLHNEDEAASPEEVLAEFFHAQLAADCERMIEVVSTESWSGGGKRSRAEFLVECNKALGDDAPTTESDVPVPDEVFIRVEGDEAEVTTNDRHYLDRHSHRLDYALAGSLVRQDGEWRVEADEGLLRIGPSATATVRAYFEAYANRECDRLVDFVSKEARRPLQARCVNPSLDPLKSSVLGAVQVSFDGDSKATATVGDPAVGPATLVKEGLSWKVASFPVLPEDLETMLLDEVTVNGQPCFEWSPRFDDSPAPLFGDDIVPQAFVRREFFDGQVRLDGRTCDLTLSLYGFRNEQEADEAAGSLGVVDPTHAFIAHGSLVVEVELRRDDLEEYGSTDAAALVAAQVNAL